MLLLNLTTVYITCINLRHAHATIVMHYIDCDEIMHTSRLQTITYTVVIHAYIYRKNYNYSVCIFLSLQEDRA